MEKRDISCFRNIAEILKKCLEKHNIWDCDSGERGCRDFFFGKTWYFKIISEILEKRNIWDCDSGERGCGDIVQRLSITSAHTVPSWQMKFTQGWKYLFFLQKYPFFESLRHILTLFLEVLDWLKFEDSIRALFVC